MAAIDKLFKAIDDMTLEEVRELDALLSADEEKPKPEPEPDKEKPKPEEKPRSGNVFHVIAELPFAGVGDIGDAMHLEWHRDSHESAAEDVAFVVGLLREPEIRAEMKLGTVYGVRVVAEPKDGFEFLGGLEATSAGVVIFEKVYTK